MKLFSNAVFRAMHMSLECRKTWNCMGMSWIILPPFSSMLVSSRHLATSIRITFTNEDSIGYMVMLYPSCILISHIGPSRWLPTCEASFTPMQIYSEFLFTNGDNRCCGGYWHAAYPPLPTLSRLVLKIWRLDLANWPTVGLRTPVPYRFLRRRNLARLFYHHQVRTEIVV